MSELSVPVDTSQVTFARNRPAEWDALVDFADAALAKFPPRLERDGDIVTKDLVTYGHPLYLDREAVVPVLKRVDAMDDDTLDAVRYYGLGRALCGYAKNIYQPANRQAIINEHIRRVVEFRRALPGSHVIRPKEIGTFITLHEFDDAVNEGLDELGEGGRLALDAAVTGARYRRLAVPGSDKPNRIKHTARDAIAVELVQGRKPARDALVNATLGASMVVWNRTVLANRAVEGVPASRPLRIKDFNAAGLSRAARAASTLRFDEFMDPDIGGKLITAVEGAGRPTVEFDWDNAPECPAAEVPNLRTIHSERLTCPASSVKDLIPYTIEMSRDIMVGAIRQLRQAPR